MKHTRIDHNLIEYMLTLLDSSKDNIDNNKQSSSIHSSDFYKTEIAYEIIQFMDEMPGGFLIYHADGNEEIIYANNALLRIFQCADLKEFQELTGNSFRGVVHPDDLDAVEKSIAEQIINSQYDLDYVEYRIIQKSGAIRWIEDYGHFIHSNSIGDIFYVFLTDCTEKKNQIIVERTNWLYEQKKKEEQMQSLIEEYDKEKQLINREYLRRLEVIEGLSVHFDSILYVELDNDLVLPYRLNDRIQNFFKDNKPCQFSQFISEYINTWVYNEDREQLQKEIQPSFIIQKLLESKTYYVNYRILTDETIHYSRLRIVNVGRKENISQIVIGYRNMDDEIAREMTQNQILEDALKKAKLSNVAKDVFLANMSHDIRTPLNAIFGFTKLAKKNSHDSDIVKQYLDKIEASSQELLNLIEKVLELSRIESQDIKEVECNLYDIIQEAYQALLPRAFHKNIEFVLKDNDLKYGNIYADRNKLKQCFHHLMSNAVKYTNSGGRVDVDIKEIKDLSNDYVVFKFIVKDTGVGISQKFLEHIFEPFEREKNTTFSGIYGTGLGLTLTKNIVEKMNGNIDVESMVGKGSTFTMTLRLRVQNHSKLNSVDTRNIIKSLKGQKILLVDDNELNLEIEVEILEELGLVIETATNGEIAVEKIRNSKLDEYAFILMDIQMPVMDGRKATEIIRSFDNLRLASIPIIALSANAFESDRQLSLKCGMNAHLTKPINIDELLEMISKIMDMKR